jgi:two-component system nitrate/nitrite response regulator NarP
VPTGISNGSAPKVAVCLIERSPLAASQLVRLLKTDRKLQVHVRSESAANGHADVSVFVIDRGTLAMPLSVLLAQLEVESPDAKIVIIDQPASKEELCTLVSGGIHGFLSYAEIDTKLLSVIQTVAAGRLKIPTDILEEYVVRSRTSLLKRKKRQSVLTPREQSIADLVTQRLSNKEIASMLEITESTVKFHLSNIFGKLGVRTRELIPRTGPNGSCESNGYHA